MKKTIALFFAALFSVLLVGCGDSPPPAPTIIQQPQAIAPVPAAPQVQYVQAPAPTVIQAAPQSNGMHDMLLGGLIGHAIGSSGGRPAAAPVINRTYVNKTVVVQSPRTISRPAASFSGRRR